MINLLSDDYKKDIRAARVNVILIRYIALVVAATIFLLGALYMSHFVLEQTEQSSLAQIEANDTKAEVYSDTKAEVDQLSQGLTQAKNAFAQETRYSKVLPALAALMPAGTIIDKLELSETSITAPVTLKVFAKSSNEATMLQNQFRTSPLISNPNFESVSETGGIDGYPTSITMTFTLNKAGAI